jgi:Family of unknown function (DUF6599)
VSRESIFNSRKRKVRRTRISNIEIGSAGLILLTLVFLLYWVSQQKNLFDPDFRDLPLKDIKSSTTSTILYNKPLRRWVEAGNASQSPAMDLGLFSPGIREGGWEPERSVKTFNKDNLFEKINGEADKFLQRGFKQLHFLRLINKDSSIEISIELFDQGGFKGALGVFAEYLSQNTELTSRKGIVFLTNSAGAIARKGRFFIRIVGSTESPAVKVKSIQILESFTSLPEPIDENPFEYNFFVSRLIVDPAWITFQVVNVFQFDFARDFWFAQPDPSHSGRIFLHLAPSAEAAIQLFDQVAEEQAYDYEVVKTGSAQVILQHRYLKTWFVIGRENALVYGVEKMEQPQIAEISIRQILDALGHEE